MTRISSIKKTTSLLAGGGNLKKIFIFIMVLILSLTGCTQRPMVEVEWVDFINHNNITYMATKFTSSNEMIESEIGKTLFNVSENIHDPEYKTKEGDAAFLPVGTPIYKLKDYRTEFRVAVKREGQFIVYEVSRNPYAKTGKDLFDIKDKVVSVSINSAVDNSKVVDITDQVTVKKMVLDILDAQVETKVEEKSNKRYLLSFNLKDQTSVDRTYWIDENIIWGYLKPSQEFKTLITNALPKESN